MDEILLAYDTAGPWLSLAIQSPRGRSFEQFDFGLLHQELLANRVKSMIHTHSLAINDLEGIICSRGPGSFTGLRIGMSLAKGLSRGLSKPIISISTLDAMAQSMIHQIDKGYLLTLIDGKKNRYFWALYHFYDGAWSLDLGPGDNDLEGISWKIQSYRELQEVKEPLYVTSPWGTNYSNKIKPYFGESLDGYGSVQNLAEFYLNLGRDLFLRKDFDDANQGINYLRPSQAEE